MNKERAKEELRDRKILAEIEYNQSEDAKKKDNLLRYIQALDTAIESLETRYQMNNKGEITPLDNEWVDVNDRLPKESENVLITCFYCYSGEYDVTLGNCNSNGEWYYADERVLISNADSTEENSAQIVIAWKPLPTPFERKE